MSRTIRRPVFSHQHPRVQHVGDVVRHVPVGVGLPEDPGELQKELEGYMDVLLGRVPPPVEAGSLTLMEVADAYHARACEMQNLILKAEREGGVFKGSKYYKFRTGELRAFIELSKRSVDLGSRRLTQEKLLFDMENEGLA